MLEIFRKSGDEMVYRGTHAFATISGQTITITVGSENTTANVGYHTGIEVYVQTGGSFGRGQLNWILVPSSGVGHDCNKSIQLDENNPMTFVLSPDYPGSFPAIGECRYTINASDSIRANFFDFKTNDTTNTFIVYGKDVNGSSVSYPLR